MEYTRAGRLDYLWTTIRLAVGRRAAPGALVARALAGAPWGGLWLVAVVSSLRLMACAVDRVANVRGAADDLEGLGEAAEDGSERQGIQRRPDVIVMAQIGNEVAQRADGPDERHEADGDLRDSPWQAKIASEVAEEEPRRDIADKRATPSDLQV